MECVAESSSAGVPPALFHFSNSKTAGRMPALHNGQTEMQLQDLPDLLRYYRPLAQGFLPQRPSLPLLVPGVGHEFILFGAGESARPGCVVR
jgi:hypothetical protein